MRLPANGWAPRPYQRKAWAALEAGIKRAVLIWHRRGGKDEVCIHRTAIAAHERVGGYWHMLPEATQGRKVVWDAVNPHSGKRRIDEAFPAELRETTRDHEMAIRFRNGSLWQVVGSDNFHSLMGSPPIGVVFSEWALADPQAWAYIRPILAENGGWAIFPTTPRGRNHAATMFDAYKDDPTWFVERLTAHDTGVFSADVLERERIEYLRELGPQFGQSLFDQEYLCSFDAAVVGSYYAHLIAQAEKDGRVGEVPFDPGRSVETWWDLGYSDATAIWFVQRAGQAIRVIDYYEASGVGIEHYAKMLKARSDERGYLYAEHLWPHDGGHGSFDTGKTRVEVAKDLGFKPKVMPKHDIDDGIQAVRVLLPRCWFDAKRCERGLSALRQYRAEWDDTLKTLKHKPLHDWSSHAADAFRTGAKFTPSTSWDETKALEVPDIGVV